MIALDTTALESPFRGLDALLLEKRRSLVRAALWFAFPVGVFASFLARVKHAEPTDLAWVTAVALVVAAFLGPIVATSAVTISGNQVGARSRRDELLALPLGRLAIPLATLLNALAISVASYLAFLFGLSFFLGRAKVLGAVFTPPIENEFPFTAAGRFGAATSLFIALWSMATISQASNLVLLLLGLAGGLLGVLPVLAGYSDLEMVLYMKLWVGSLAAFALVAPFALYARSPRHWAVMRTPSPLNRQVNMNQPPPGPAGCGVLTAALALGVLGYLGLGKAFLVVLVAGAFFMRRSWRGLKAERRLPSHTAVALGLGLAFVTPVVAFGLVTDARRFAEAARPEPDALASYALSPDGRHVVACFQTKVGAMARVLVVDLSGKEPPRALPPRRASLEPACCWSRDGRYLAVHEAALGRLCPPEVVDLGRHTSMGADVMGVDDFMERQLAKLALTLTGTWILDTQTGALAERDVLALAPGWSSPDELLSISPCSLGGCEVQDGRGRSVLWDKPDLAVDAYSSAGAELLDARARYVLGAGGLAPVDTSSRWDLVVGPERSKKGAHPSEAKAVWDYTFTKGERRVVVPDNPIALPIWLSPSRVLLLSAGDRGGYYRLDLETGERFEYPRGARKRALGTYSALWSGGDSATRFVGPPRSIVPVEGGFAVVDLETGAETPLPSFERFVPAIVEGKLVLGLLGNQLAVSEDGKAPRPVF